MAYTYLVGWSRLGVWYYGVRTAKASSPADLWVTHFTSSHRVKAFRAAHGEPDVVQVRQVFDNREAALRWEGRNARIAISIILDGSVECRCHVLS